MKVYEVFRSEEEGGAVSHVGSVQAADPDFAALYAREVYSRRHEAFKLWVVPRDAIRVLEDEDLLRPPLDRSFKMGVGYRVTVAKRKTLKDKLRGGA